jgi:hypothetical protein
MRVVVSGAFLCQLLDFEFKGKTLAYRHVKMKIDGQKVWPPNAIIGLLLSNDGNKLFSCYGRCLFQPWKIGIFVCIMESCILHCGMKFFWNVKLDNL